MAGVITVGVTSSNIAGDSNSTTIEEAIMVDTSRSLTRLNQLTTPTTTRAIPTSNTINNTNNKPTNPPLTATSTTNGKTTKCSPTNTTSTIAKRGTSPNSSSNTTTIRETIINSNSNQDTITITIRVEVVSIINSKVITIDCFSIEFHFCFIPCFNNRDKQYTLESYHFFLCASR